MSILFILLIFIVSFVVVALINCRYLNDKIIVKLDWFIYIVSFILFVIYTVNSSGITLILIIILAGARAGLILTPIKLKKYFKNK